MASHNSVISVVGGEIPGDKAAMLAEHEALVSDAGFKIPPTTVIASEALDPLKNAFDPYDPKYAIATTANQHGIDRMITEICRKHAADPVLAIRSSAEGDATGTGVYDSIFAGANVASATSALHRVVDSFHSRGAVDFRQQVGLGENFAVMVQPVIGQDLPRKGGLCLFGPAVSGVGYSETRDYPDGVISVVAGLGGGVDRRGAELISSASAQEVRQLAETYEATKRGGGDLSLFDYIAAARKGQKSSETRKAETDFRAHPRAKTLKRVAGLALVLDGRSDIAGYTAQRFRFDLGDGIHLGENDAADDTNPLIRALRAFSHEKMLESLQAMQQTAGYPLYVEWAVGYDGQDIQPYILQIAPCEVTDRTKLEVQPGENPLITAKNVHGHGTRSSNKLVYLSKKKAIPELAEFNGDPKNAGYILVYPATLTSRASRYGAALRFADFSNASTVIETRSNIHLASMLSHIGGAIDKTGKFYGQVDRRKSGISIELELLLKRKGIRQVGQSTRGMRILKGDFAVCADENIGEITIESK